MTYALLVGTLYLFGTIGFAGMTTIWIRLWQFLREGRLTRLWRQGGGARGASVAIAASWAGGLYAWQSTAQRLFRCINDPPCGPNRAAPWITLGIFGFFYLGLELVLLIERRVHVARAHPGG